MIDHNHLFSKIRAYQFFVKTGKTTFVYLQLAVIKYFWFNFGNF
jgi:hypothetical protein